MTMKRFLLLEREELRFLEGSQARGQVGCMEGRREGSQQAWMRSPGSPACTLPVANRVYPFAFHLTLNFQCPLDEERCSGT